MHAAVGDRIVIGSNAVAGPVREGVIEEVRHLDGSPPYLVRWVGTEQIALVFPGPDAHVVPAPRDGHGPGEAAPRPAPPPDRRHVRTWSVAVYVFEDGRDTTAQAVLSTEAPEPVVARGEAHARPGDAVVAEIGDELAVARALRRLSDALLGLATQDLSDVEGREVVVDR